MSGLITGRRQPFASKSVAHVPGLIYKTFESPVTKVVDDKQGLVEALVNSTGVKDLQNDVMEKGAWTDVINKMSTRKESWPSILWSHSWEQPVGRVESAWETDSGLWIRGRFNLATTRGHDAYQDVKFGSVKQWSVGFQPADDGHATDGYGVHHISKVGMWPEVSCVLVGASPGTRTTTIKSGTLPDYLRYKSRPSWMEADVDWDKVERLVYERLAKPQRDDRPFLAPERHVDPDAPKVPFNAVHDVIADLVDDSPDPDGREAFLRRVTAGLTNLTATKR